MPYVERSKTVAVDPQTLYEMAKRPEEFPKYMPDVKSIEVIERGDGYSVTIWNVEVAGRRFRWTERDEYDDANRIIRYRQVEGDLKRFEGEWRFDARPDGTEITLTVDIDVGMPGLAPLINPVLQKALQSNTDRMLEGIVRQAAAQTP